VEYKQQANIINEKELLWKLDHPFIIRLYDTYKDADRLYMLLEVVQGGELFARLQNSATVGRIPPSEARFYSACVLDALDYLHGMSIVYRDLKRAFWRASAAGGCAPLWLPASSHTLPCFTPPTHTHTHTLLGCS